MNIRYISVRPCAVETPNWLVGGEGVTRKTSTGPNQGTQQHEGVKSVFVNDYAHTGKRGEEGSGKHGTLTFRLHQEQDFLTSRARRTETSSRQLETVRREHERATSSRRKRASWSRSRSRSRSWSRASTGQPIDRDSGSLFGQWSVGGQ